MSESEDTRAIAAIRATLEAAENGGDWQGMAALFDDEIVVMVPDYAVQEGKAASAAFVRERLQESCAWFNRRIGYTSAEVFVDGAFGSDRGTFAFDVSPRSGGKVDHVTGKYFWLLARRPSGWKLTRIIVSRDEAAPEGQEADSLPPAP